LKGLVSGFAIGLLVGTGANAFGQVGASERSPTGSQRPLVVRDAAIFRAAFSGVPRATCVSRRSVVVCGDRATYYVDLKRPQACLLQAHSGRYGQLPTRTRWVRGCP
jgi:hypothetical protein